MESSMGLCVPFFVCHLLMLICLDEEKEVNYFILESRSKCISSDLS